MDAKEKAEELVGKFKPHCYCYMGGGMLSNTYDDDVATDNAKQCALISVDEILNINSVDKDYDLSNFWEEVKQEIEKL